MTWLGFVLIAQAVPPAPAREPRPAVAAPTPAAPPTAAPAAPYTQEPADEPEGPAPVAPLPAAPPPVQPVTPMVQPMPMNMQVPEAPPPSSPPRHRRELILEAAGGAYYTRLFSVQAYGGGGRFGIGSSGQTNSWVVALEYRGGQTFHGLGLTMWHIGWSYDWHFDRLRIGLYPNLGSASLERASRRGYTLDQLSLGFDVHGSVDLVPLGNAGALFLRAVVNVDASNGAPIWGPSAWLGVRLGA